MGAIRDRVASGRKAAQTNRSRHGLDFYGTIAPLGGKAVKAGSRAYSRVTDLASKSAKIRHNTIDTTVIYTIEVIIAPYENKKIETHLRRWSKVWSRNFHSRDDARLYKRALREKYGFKSKIYYSQFNSDQYEGGFIESRKEVW